MATIRQRQNRWQVIVKQKGYPNQSKTFDLKKDAEKWGRHQERLMDAGQWIDRSEADQTTLKTVLERYAREVSCHKGGAAVEAIRINALKRSSLAQYVMSSITGQLIAEYRDSRLLKVSGSTVTRELQILSHVFTVAIREWSFGLHSNPVSLIRKPKVGPPRDRVLTADQRQALITTCNQCQNPWVKPVVIFALETATRRGEILTLHWGAIDLQRCTAKVTGKTGSRTIPLSQACVNMLKELPRNMNGIVFPISIETLKQAYQRAINRAGITNFTFHDLRHDALTRLAKIGLNILELRAISGHTTANMLQRYVSIDPEELAKKIA